MGDNNLRGQQRVMIQFHEPPVIPIDNCGLGINSHEEGTLSEANGSLGCRHNSSSGSVLIRQLTEAPLLNPLQLTQEKEKSSEDRSFTGCFNIFY